MFVEFLAVIRVGVCVFLLRSTIWDLEREGMDCRRQEGGVRRGPRMVWKREEDFELETRKR